MSLVLDAAVFCCFGETLWVVSASSSFGCIHCGLPTAVHQAHFFVAALFVVCLASPDMLDQVVIIFLVVEEKREQLWNFLEVAFHIFLFKLWKNSSLVGLIKLY